MNCSIKCPNHCWPNHLPPLNGHKKKVIETSFPTQREAIAKEPEATTALRELCRLHAARPTAMSAFSSDVTRDVDMSIDEHDDSAMNVEEAHTADQEGTTEVEKSMAKRAKVGEEGKEQDEGMGGEEQAEVREFPTDMPMENEYPGRNYYVRKCYSTYYDLMMHLFDDKSKKGVTVTGTSGIGKSIFMAYFFQTYIEQYSDAIVLFASYDKTSALKEVALAKEGKLIDQERDKSARMEDMMSEHRDFDGKHNIWLLDGPPKKIPVGRRWVSFTSPNETWMKKLSKNTATTANIYMNS